MRVLSVVGNRPQFIKSAPLSLALHAAAIDEVVVHTGQHYDRELSQLFFEELELAEPHYRLDLRTAEVDAMRSALAAVIAAETPDVVLVYGDTNSTLAGALAAAEAGASVAHVEAGLRSGDLTMPEERNRIEVDRRAATLFAPDERSRAILAAEDLPGAIHVVGDVMADASRIFVPIARTRARVHERLGLPRDRPYAVLTIHREANTEPGRLARLVSELNATGRTFVFPVHPRTQRVLREHDIRLAPTLHAVEPIGYLDMLALVAGSTHVVTDSGGLQKEAYWLGVPCVTLRPSTEWVDTVEAGANTLIHPDHPEVLAAVLDEASFPPEAPQLYGDGHAAERIAAVLAAAK
jgi:UDP-N-acetylglucosamine 2-epimerase